ncbi:AMP-binding protein [Haloferula sp.]|uniref:AMP-binding protein n=1 Tax=Haloferula sp. TaxID=2497595 RepID=UPI00329DE7AE
MPATSECPSEIDDLETSISARFEAVVKRNPDAIAVSHHGRTWTYQQLNRRADEIALAIQRHDASDTPVALAGDTSITMVAAVLATFKLGRPFVFIGPELPDSRSEYLLKTTGCHCVYCESPEHQRGVFRQLDLKILGPDSEVDFNEAQDPLPTPGPDDHRILRVTERT